MLTQFHTALVDIIIFLEQKKGFFLKSRQRNSGLFTARFVAFE